MVCQMIAVGETTGALDTMLTKIADFYEDEVDNAVANLMSLLEPMVILVLGVVTAIGFAEINGLLVIPSHPPHIGFRAEDCPD